MSETESLLLWAGVQPPLAKMVAAWNEVQLCDCAEPHRCTVPKPPSVCRKLAGLDGDASNVGEQK